LLKVSSGDITLKVLENPTKSGAVSMKHGDNKPPRFMILDFAIVNVAALCRPSLI
tara:strand:+ start:600 stop:764 length:165 start_codon:yes stop_codon:yes gene_type:complete